MGRGIDSRNRVWNWVANLRPVRQRYGLAGRYDSPMPMYFVPSPQGRYTDSELTQWYLYCTVCQIYVSKPEGSTFFCRINYCTSSSAVKLVAGFISMLVVACRRLWDREIYELWDTQSKRDHNAHRVDKKGNLLQLVQYRLKRGQHSIGFIFFRPF